VIDPASVLDKSQNPLRGFQMNDLMPWPGPRFTVRVRAGFAHQPVIAPVHFGWEYRRRVGRSERLEGDVGFESVTVPHDAMLASDRDPDGEPAVASFGGAACEYRRALEVW
jgi:hypothetical protein